MNEDPHKLAVFPRPRSNWQAIDAGMLLARAHYWKLLVLWLTFAIPIATTVTAIALLGFSPFWLTSWVIWWFKPLYELPILMYLSRVLFNQTTSIRLAIIESKSQIIPLLKSYLTLSRLSTARSMTAPVVFLEHQKGKARRNRVNTLTDQPTRAYTLLLAWLHIESIGSYLVFGILLSLIHSDMGLEQIWKQLTQGATESGNTNVYIYTAVPMVLAAIVAPFYVSSGFLLYINRRMQLEAWDIEHQFQDLESKHKQHTSHTFLASCSALFALIGVFSVISALSLSPFKPAMAETSKNLAPIESIRDSISSMYENEDFGSSKTVKSLRFKKPETKNNKTEINTGWMTTALEFLFSISRALIYLLAGMCVALVAWALLKFMPNSWHFKRQRPTLELLDVEHHPLTRSQPDDIRTSAEEALQQGNHREAISLLYRGALRTVMRRHSLSIPKSATEKECQYWVAQCEVEEQTNHFKQLVGEWMSIAYANRQPTDKQTRDLIDFWESNFKFDEAT